VIDGVEGGGGRNLEEWAVLQEILKEAEEESLDEDEGSSNAEAIERIISSFDTGDNGDGHHVAYHFGPSGMVAPVSQIS